MVSPCPLHLYLYLYLSIRYSPTLRRYHRADQLVSLAEGYHFQCLRVNLRYNLVGQKQLAPLFLLLLIAVLLAPLPLSLLFLHFPLGVWLLLLPRPLMHLRITVVPLMPDYKFQGLNLRKILRSV